MTSRGRIKPGGLLTVSCWMLVVAARHIEIDEGDCSEHCQANGSVLLQGRGIAVTRTRKPKWKETHELSGDVWSLKQHMLRMHQIPDGYVCAGTPIDGWGGLGEHLSRGQCKLKCMKRKSCWFIGWKDGHCSGWEACDTLVKRSGKFVFWEKVGASFSADLEMVDAELPVGERCQGPPIGSWGGFGEGRKDLTPQECKKVCMRKPQCKFATLKDGECSGFADCQSTEVEAGFQTWQRPKFWPQVQVSFAMSPTAKDKIVDNALRDGLRQSGSEDRKIELRVLPRVWWQKSYRCQESEESCEECRPDAGTLGTYHDCWGYSWPKKTKDAKKDRKEELLLGGQRVLATKKIWKRFKAIIHVRCHGNTLQATFSMKLVRFGSLRLYWDGEEIWAEGKHSNISGVEVVTAKGSQQLPMIYDDTSSPDNMKKRESHITIAMASAGAHELSIEFSPSEHAPGLALGPHKGAWTREAEDKFPTAVINDLSFFMEPGFTKCEDSKVCLLELSKSPAGRLLRNTNALQLLCLTSEEDESLEKSIPDKRVRGMCKLWRECLAGAGNQYHNHLLELLNAAGVTNEGETPQPLNPFGHRFSPLAGSDKEDKHGCMHPPTEDVESWNCDCYSDMLRRCHAVSEQGLVSGRFSTVLCLRAQFCSYDRVCRHWKTQTCGAPGIGEMMRAVTSLDADGPVGLLEAGSDFRAAAARRSIARHAHAGAGAAGVMDSSLRGKRCI